MSRVTTAADAPETPVRRRWSLKTYVVGLVVVFVVAAGTGTVYQRRAAAHDARSGAARDARFGAGIAARDIAADVGLVQTTVGTTAANPTIAGVFEAPAGCTLTFGGAGAFTTGHLDIVGADGSVACSSLPATRPSGYAGADWMERALDGPTLAGPVVDARTGKQVVLAAAPVTGHGAVVAFLDLEALGPGLASVLGGPRHLEFLVTNADGDTVLARSVDPARWVGTPLSGTSFAGPLAQVDRRDLDGTPRLYGQATVEGLGWKVFAGANRSDALAAANRLAQRDLGITLAGLLVFLGAALVIHRRIARPIRKLSAGVRAATTHTASGPITVSGPAEVVTLVEDFNTMMAAAVRDETERKRAETERRSLEDRLHQSERLESLGQLAGGIAHDFNNLLAVILNYAGFVAEQTTDNAVRADAEEIRSAAERAARLTRQLLIFGRRETVQPEVLDLDAVVTDIHNLLARSIGEHVELVVRPGAGVRAIRADRGQVEQVLVNLAVNARDAMAGGGTLTIETGSAELDAEYARLHPEVDPGLYVELTVSDTGTGIPPDVAARIFEPFFTTKAMGQGTGLGLATVYGIVTKAGGSVSVYSEEGIGTTFRVYFPAVDTPVPAPRDGSALPTSTGKGETILVVEDEPAMLDVTSRILRQNGYTVLEADTYEKALSLAGEHDFQLLLTDSVMPQMPGRELAVRIQELRPGRALLFMSGYSDGVLGPQRVLDEGAALIQKPFNEQALLEKVRSVLAAQPTIRPDRDEQPE